MTMNKDMIEINSQSKKYTVTFDDDLFALKELSGKENHVFLVDAKVWKLYYNLFFNSIPDTKVIQIDAQEEHKDYFAIGQIIPKLTEFSAKKNLTIVAIGGGIVQDIACFIASTLYRGVRWVLIPTTLLAQADSCIGAKSSINFGNYKNLLGTFWAPDEVLISTKFIDTLDSKDFYSGIGEIIKLYLIDGQESLSTISDFHSQSESDLRAHIKSLIKKALFIKKAFIEVDEFDKGIRNILNFGHCIGHAIESVTNYAVPHGQAVTLGMIWANIVSVEVNRLSQATSTSIYNAFLKTAHTIRTSELNFTADQIVDAMKKDKKREGEDLAIILMDEQGQFHRIKDLKPQSVYNTFDAFMTLLNA